MFGYLFGVICGRTRRGQSSNFLNFYQKGDNFLRPIALAVLGFTSTCQEARLIILILCLQATTADEEPENLSQGNV